MNKKTIMFFIYDLGQGGAERVLTTLANYFSSKYNVVIICVQKNESSYHVNENVKLFYCFEDDPKYNKKYSKRILRFLILLYRMYLFVKKNSPSVLIGFTTTINIYVTLIGRIYNKSIIISERLDPRNNVISGKLKLFRRLIYPLCNFLVVQNDNMGSYFRNFIHSNKIVKIYNPVNEELASKFVKSFKKEKVILSVGRLVEQKNHELLIEAFAQLESKDGWVLKIIGEGILKENLLNKIAINKLTNSVKLINNTSEIYKYYNEASFFVLASLYEGFPNVLIEALVFELPCISSNCPSGPSEIINGKNGILFENNNLLEFKNALNEMILDDNKREYYKSNAIESTARFKLKYISEQWDDLIIKCINEKI